MMVYIDFSLKISYLTFDSAFSKLDQLVLYSNKE